MKLVSTTDVDGRGWARLGMERPGVERQGKGSGARPRCDLSRRGSLVEAATAKTEAVRSG